MQKTVESYYSVPKQQHEDLPIIQRSETSEDIKRAFLGIMRDAKLLNIHDLETKYADFKTKNEKLYTVALDSVIAGTVQESIKKLDAMLRARDNMDAGLVSKLNTDMLVGNMLGKEYIYPKTETPSKEDYLRALKIIQTKSEENNDEE